MSTNGVDLNQIAQAKAFKQMEINAQRELATRAQDLQSSQNVAQICVNLLVNGDKTADLPAVTDAHNAAARYLTLYLEKAYESANAPTASIADEEFVRV